MSTNLPKKILFVTRRAPYGTGLSKEALDAILAASAYEQDVGLLFMDDGVFQLVNHQQPESINAKNMGNTLPVLPMYDIEKIYVQAAALESRALKEDQLVLPVQLLQDHEIATLLQSQEVVLSF